MRLHCNVGENLCMSERRRSWQSMIANHGMTQGAAELLHETGMAAPQVHDGRTVKDVAI